MKIKLIFLVYLVGILWQGLLNGCFAQTKIPFSMDILVKDLETEKKLNDLFFEITDDNTSKITFPSTPIGSTPLIVSLEPEHIYTATIFKEGYVKQILTVSTVNLLKSKQLKGKYHIEIVGLIFERFKDEDYSAFEKSFGIIKFNLQANDFIWNPNTTLQKKEEEIKKNRRRANKELNKLMVKQIKNTDYTSKTSPTKPKIVNTISQNAEILSDTGFVKSINTKKELVNNGEILITSIVFQNGQTKEYRRISYKWGGLFFKLNQADISEVSYNLTKTKYGF
jgi:hypothetical protein